MASYSLAVPEEYIPIEHISLMGADDLDDPLAAEGLGVRERHHRHGEEREE